MKFTTISTAFVGLTLLSGLASAASVTGNLGLTGFVTVFPLELQFGQTSGLPNSQTAVITSGSGSFAGTAVPGATAVTMNLFQGSGPGQVNPLASSFTPVNFVDVTTAGGPVEVDLTSLPITADPVCTGGATGPCRPNANSPIVLVQIAGNTYATISGSGEAFYTASPSMMSAVNLGLSATFTGESINTLLTTFGTTGSVSTVYSDLLITSAVPEPSALAFLGIGLVSLGVWKKRTAAK